MIQVHVQKNIHFLELMKKIFFSIKKQSRRGCRELYERHPDHIVYGNKKEDTKGPLTRIITFSIIIIVEQEDTRSKNEFVSQFFGIYPFISNASINSPFKMKNVGYA